MAQVYGEFRENLPNNHEFLIIGFSPSSIPIQQRWRNNGISADFIADYLATFLFLPANIDASEIQQQRAEVKGAASYIANELLENAMKFNDETTSQPIRFGLHLVEEPVKAVIFLVSNSVSSAALEAFETFIEEFLNTDAEELYLRQLERAAEGEDTQTSGLGLLTMKNDYHAKLGWKIEALERSSDTTTVTTMVQVEL